MLSMEKCCGCGACYNACPQKCISMMADELGFYYPEIDKSKCINCGLCEKVCPALVTERSLENGDELVVYGGFSKDTKLRRASSSGGFFSIIAELILNKSGVVFGAALNDECDSVSHIKIESKEELNRLRGSKYLQSKAYDCYPQVKDELLKDRLVLFSGTPCQVEGLNNYLSKKYSNLLTVEVICHGTASPSIYKKYIKELSNKYGGKVTKVSFRDEVGGNNLCMKITLSNGKIYRKDQYSDPYFRMFLSNTCLRESCYQCPSKGLYKRADITLADFWGSEKIIPDIHDGKGISLFIGHNERAKEILNEILPKTVGKEVAFERAIIGNRAYFSSYDKPIKRNKIANDVKRLGMKSLVVRYTYNFKEITKLILHKLHLTKAIKTFLRM